MLECKLGVDMIKRVGSMFVVSVNPSIVIRDEVVLSISIGHGKVLAIIFKNAFQRKRKYGRDGTGLRTLQFKSLEVTGALKLVSNVTGKRYISNGAGIQSRNEEILLPPLFQFI